MFGSNFRNDDFSKNDTGGCSWSVRDYVIGKPCNIKKKKIATDEK